MAEELSGIELREAVAREVMGYAVEHFNKTLARVEPINEIDWTVPHYESSIEAAWSVVEKMRPWTCQIVAGGDTTDAYVCFDMDGLMSHDAQADTVPLAICRAALAARAKA